ncbi:MAG TPA: L-seryl-tRNA(Sec) selenium transferase, partial [Gemmatirosa sp.]|nr:L-seryl-tRNA(Sec) selenium transferase [Gemmatirosa sp.]
APVGEPAWSDAVARALAVRTRPSLRPLLNATGVVLHTNLGRAPLADAALDAVRDAAEGFANLEYDLEAGARGTRHAHCVARLRALTGAEDALVVNNCAAALVLALAALAPGREAVVSRGELVEIGGSFRVPDIMATSGARLREVGTTNRTHLADYAAALGPDTGALVKVHRSNFAQSGFVAESTLAELATLAGEAGVPLLHDFGSGLLHPLDDVGLTGEPTARDAVACGATLVLMSGDKLLGGPQAGIVVGRADAVARLRRHPLARALRVDKLTLAALEATLALHADVATARREIPALAMLTAAPDALRARAERLADRLAAHGVAARVVSSEGSVGGGAFPTARLAGWALALYGAAPALERVLRAGALPVIARIHDARLLLDLRSVPARDDARLADAVARALADAGLAGPLAAGLTPYAGANVGERTPHHSGDHPAIRPLA